jgi:DNA-directed RNA polymerase specialized sigma24 family protein
MRRCLLLRIGEELKYREIAETLQISIQTVKTHLARGRARLRERLRIVLPGAFVENEE